MWPCLCVLEQSSLKLVLAIEPFLQEEHVVPLYQVS